MALIRFRIPLDICYGSLSLYISILHNVFLLYHIDIFVSVYKIDKASFWIGETVFFLWNSINDPLFGWLSDSRYLQQHKLEGANPNHGIQILLNRLAALKWNGPLFAISFLGFWISWIYPSIQFVVCLCLYDGFLTAIDLHHNALLADLAVSAELRAKLNSKCSIFSALGSVSVFLSYSVWNKASLTSFRWFCTGLAIFSLVGFIVSCRKLQDAICNRKKNEDYTESDESRLQDADEFTEVDITERGALKKYVSELFSQTNFLWFSMMNIVQVFHCHFNSNFFPLFLESLLGNAISPTVSSMIIGVSFVAPHINNLYFLSLCKRFGLYRVIRFLFLVKLLISLLMILAGPSHLWLLCLFIASNRVFTEGTCKLLNLVVSDLVDEDYVLHKRTQAVSALMFGMTALVSKPGQTIAPILGTWLLAFQTGHDIFQSSGEGRVNMDLAGMSSEEVAAHRLGCFNMLVYVPLACALLQLATWSRFSLRGRRLIWIKSVRAGSQYSTV